MGPCIGATSTLHGHKSLQTIILRSPLRCVNVCEHPWCQEAASSSSQGSEQHPVETTRLYSGMMGISAHVVFYGTYSITAGLLEHIHTLMTAGETRGPSVWWRVMFMKESALLNGSFKGTICCKRAVLSCADCPRHLHVTRM